MSSEFKVNILTDLFVQYSPFGLPDLATTRHGPDGHGNIGAMLQHSYSYMFNQYIVLSCKTSKYSIEVTSWMY